MTLPITGSGRVEAVAGCGRGGSSPGRRVWPDTRRLYNRQPGHGVRIATKKVRIHVSGSEGFVGAHVLAAIRHRGHAVAAPVGPIDVAMHLAPAGVRAALDEAFARSARLFALVSMVGAHARASHRELAVRGRAEELVRASGLPFVILEPEVMWGPGDVFTNEIAH